MVGISATLTTKDDWINTFKYVMKQSEAGPKAMLKTRLLALRQSSKMLVLKSDVTKPAEEQTPQDFKSVDDPASPLVMSGLTLSEIDQMVSKLSEGEVHA